MNTGLKVFLWVIGGIVTLVVLIAVAGFFMVRQSIDSFEEYETFAQTATKHECLEELGRRASTCSGAMCVVSSTSFGMICLETAEGDKSDICDGNLDLNEFSTQACEDSSSKQYCKPSIDAAISEYCK